MAHRTDNHSDLTLFKNRLWKLMEEKHIYTTKELAKMLYTQKLVTVKQKNSYDEPSKIYGNAIGAIDKKIQKHLNADTTKELQGEFVIAYCNFFGCSSDYLFGFIDCKSHDKQFIHDYTGLSDKSIDILQTENILTSSHCIEIINILINDHWTHPEARHTKYSFIDVFSNYLRFCENEGHKYALSRNGNIKVDPKADMKDLDGTEKYSNADIHFTSKQLETMFIMEIEDILKALKESYMMKKNKAPNTN